MKNTINDIKNQGGQVLLCVVLVSKLNIDEISGTRIRSVIRTTMVG